MEVIWKKIKKCHRTDCYGIMCDMTGLCKYRLEEDPKYPNLPAEENGKKNIDKKTN